MSDSRHHKYPPGENSITRWWLETGNVGLFQSSEVRLLMSMYKAAMVEMLRAEEEKHSMHMAVETVLDHCKTKHFRVEAPVTRRSPHSAGRVGFPHPVPRFQPFRPD
jgi:hypothetical protein